MGEEDICKRLDKLITILERQESADMMLLVQLMELNGLMKKLNYISGTDAGLSMEEIKTEIEWLQNFVKCITEKGTVCPIRGLSRKLGKHLEKE